MMVHFFNLKNFLDVWERCKKNRKTPHARFCRVFFSGLFLPLAYGGDWVLGVAHRAGAGGLGGDRETWRLTTKKEAKNMG